MNTRFFNAPSPLTVNTCQSNFAFAGFLGVFLHGCLSSLHKKESHTCGIEFFLANNWNFDKGFDLVENVGNGNYNIS